MSDSDYQSRALAAEALLRRLVELQSEFDWEGDEDALHDWTYAVGDITSDARELLEGKEP